MNYDVVGAAAHSAEAAGRGGRRWCGQVRCAGLGGRGRGRQRRAAARWRRLQRYTLSFSLSVSLFERLRERV